MHWKKEYEKALADAYPDTTIKWGGDDPTLVIPDDRIHQQQEIVDFATAWWAANGGEVKFYPERAIHT